MNGRILVWFSYGAASACAAKLAVAKYQSDNLEILNCNTTVAEHPDNSRFCVDVERWIGRTVKVIESERFKSPREVWEERRYMSGPKGAPCTDVLKRKPRIAYQQPDDVHIFGFTADEQRRIANFEVDNPHLWLEWILRDAGLTKPDCFRMLSEAGIELPAMYRLGYKNNNCLGCVKATSPSYWNAIRRDFPDVFSDRAKQSREIGARLARVKGVRVFLDELPPDSTEHVEENLSCGPQCVRAA